MIKSLLIANRGEIACRIIKTAKRMGIRTIAIYSEADRQARHVRLADEAHFVGAAPAADSYLRAVRIIKLAKESGAEAIHPGYGFLSENADFAELTKDAGMIFVGPPADAIRAMGLKDKAKELMSAADVPVVPGFHGPNQDPTFLKRKAYEVGYPVLIKAVAGGGGKGMRLVNKAMEFDDALDAAKRESLAAFKNDVVLIEKFISSPRHIEIQVFADSHGNAVHLYERDCSLQRRHQKVIEEAPAPGMTQEMRDAMGKAACDAARAVGYEGAGTVEFIVDGEGGLKADGFWFMEMNTRLQVEHPVTEMITGQDLVEWQLRVASGEKLPLTQDEISITGHAVEARIYAEDADNGFLPSTGRLVAMQVEAQPEGLRVDTGVEQGDEISPYYDPMIAKLIFHGANREEALAGLAASLDGLQIAGPVSNTPFLARLVRHKDFAAGNFDTGLIDRELNKLTSTKPASEEVVATGLSALLQQITDKISSRTPVSPWQQQNAFQPGGTRTLSRGFRLNGEATSCVILQDVDGMAIQESDQWVRPVSSLPVFNDGERVLVLDGGKQSVFEPERFDASVGSGAVSSDGAILAPMHGKIIAVTVAKGDVVEEGDLLFSVEAMKMEHAVVAPFDGTITQVSAAENDQVENGAVVLVLKAASSQEDKG